MCVTYSLLYTLQAMRHFERHLQKDLSELKIIDGCLNYCVCHINVVTSCWLMLQIESKHVIRLTFGLVLHSICQKFNQDGWHDPGECKHHATKPVRRRDSSHLIVAMSQALIKIFFFFFLCHCIFDIIKTIVPNIICMASTHPSLIFLG